MLNLINHSDLILSFAHILNSHQYGKTEIRREKAAEYWVKTASIISAMQGLIPIPINTYFNNVHLREHKL